MFRSKSTNQSGERNERLPDLCFSICRFSEVVFILRAQPHAQSLVLFPIVFGINLIHFFNEKKDSAARNSIVCFAASNTCHAISANFTKNANCSEEWNVFGNGKCELSANQKRRNEGANFWQGKVQNSSPIVRCKFLARKSAKLIANVSATMVTSLPDPSISLSLYLSLSLSLSLSHRAYLTHNTCINTKNYWK